MPYTEPTAPVRVEAPPVSILTVARQVTEVNWRSGVSHLPNGCSPAENYPTCEVEPVAPDKASPNPNSAATFDTWPIYLPDACFEKPFFAEDWRARAREALDAYTPWAMSLELSNGAASGNPSLQSTATDITVAGATDLPTTFDRLMRARVSAGFGGRATLHVPTWLIPYCDDSSLLERAGSVLTAIAGMCLVSPGPGYTGISPDTTLNLVPGDSEGWVYITSGVEYAYSDITILPSDDPEDQALRLNRVEVWAERFGLIRFDPCGVFAQRATGIC